MPSHNRLPDGRPTDLRRRVPPKDVKDLKRTMLSNSRRIRKFSARVRAYFKHRNIRYAV